MGAERDIGGLREGLAGPTARIPQPKCPMGVSFATFYIYRILLKPWV